MYGSIGNFDVINDTGKDSHGFEIEYEGLKSTDIGYTWTYSRYGNPTLVEVPATTTTPLKTIVRYVSSYDSATGQWTATTNAAGFPWMVTGAHQCTSPTATDGCEHFVNGMFTSNVYPKSVTYHWLVESNPGALVRGDSSTPPPAINIPAFQAVVVQPAPINNVVQAPVVQVVAVMPAPPEPANAQWGTPHWMKVIKTTIHNANPVNAALLINEDKNGDGIPDWQNGEPAQVESEWYLVQTEPAGAKVGAKGAHQGAVEKVKLNEKVTRKYEFYKYTGKALSFDGETHEAMCDAVSPDNIHGSQTSVSITDYMGNSYNYNCSTDAIIGDYIGANMVGFELAAPLTAIEVIDNGQIGKQYVARSVVSGGNTPYTVTTDGIFPLGLTIDPVTGILTGSPTESGIFTFNVNATDADGKAITKAYTISITDINGNLVVPTPTISTQMLDNGVEGAIYYLQLTEVSGTAPFAWSVVPALPNGLTLSAGGVISGTPAKGDAGITTHTITVTDKNNKANSKMFTLSIAAAPVVAVACSGVDEPNLAVTARLGSIAKYDGTLIKSAYLTTANNNVAIPAAGVAYAFNGVAAGNFPIGALISYSGSYGAANGLNGTPMWCIPTSVTVKPTPIVCVAPQVRDAATNTCVTPVPVCVAPQVLNAVSNTCVTPPIVCVAPQVRDAATNTCVTPVPVCVAPQVLNAATNTCITPVPVCVAPQVLDSASNTCVTPPVVAPTSCAAPAGSKSASGHAAISSVSGASVVISGKAVNTLGCTKITYKGHAKSLVIGYDDEYKGYSINGVIYATSMIVDDGK